VAPSQEIKELKTNDLLDYQERNELRQTRGEHGEIAWGKGVRAGANAPPQFSWWGQNCFFALWIICMFNLGTKRKRAEGLFWSKIITLFVCLSVLKVCPPPHTHTLHFPVLSWSLPLPHFPVISKACLHFLVHSISSPFAVRSYAFMTKNCVRYKHYDNDIISNRVEIIWPWSAY
jgi:hypothetical protein